MNATMTVIEQLEKLKGAATPEQLKAMLAEQGMPNHVPSFRLAMTAALTQGPCDAKALRARMVTFGWRDESPNWWARAPLSRGGFNNRMERRARKREAARLLVGRKFVYVGGWLLRKLGEQFSLNDHADRLVAADFYEDEMGGDPAVAQLLRKAKKCTFGY